ncbi:hypothetical protein KKC88_06035 [Patescibacteria group bacterium]|nr:hypothetical protein [Patescibacteria group bacterium]MBU1673957.1 hypothetical protein [Patescibacteria group bacterium]MBU1963951.1 hypothetical protein [Patescibacteria group bacterium]
MPAKKTTTKKPAPKKLSKPAKEEINKTVEQSLEKANSPSKAPSKLLRSTEGAKESEVGPTRTENEPEEKKSFREQMGPGQAFGIPCLVTIILIFLFMVFIGVVVKLSLNSAGV